MITHRKDVGSDITLLPPPSKTPPKEAHHCWQPSEGVCGVPPAALSGEKNRANNTTLLDYSTWPLLSSNEDGWGRCSLITDVQQN